MTINQQTSDESARLQPQDYDKHIYIDASGKKIFPCAVLCNPPCTSKSKERYLVWRHIKDVHKGQILLDNGDGRLEVVGNLYPRPNRFNVDFQRVENPPSRFHATVLQGREAESLEFAGIPVRMAPYNSNSAFSAPVPQTHSADENPGLQPPADVESLRPPRGESDEDMEDGIERPVAAATHNNGDRYVPFVYLHTRVMLVYINRRRGQEIIETVPALVDACKPTSSISLNFIQSRYIRWENSARIQLQANVHDSYGSSTAESLSLLVDPANHPDHGQAHLVLGRDWTMGRTIEHDLGKSTWRFVEGKERENDVVGVRRGRAMRGGYRSGLRKRVEGGEGEQKGGA